VTVHSGEAYARGTMSQQSSPEQVAALGERRLRQLVIIAVVVLAIVAICVITVTLFANSLRNGVF
jgi:hypothetical protein